jgi:hypothetical protein
MARLCGRWCTATTRALRALGAEVIVGDLTNPLDVSAAMFGNDRMFST